MLKATTRYLLLFFSTTAVCFGAVPPPPVNQFLGIPDSSFNDLHEADCRACHNQNPPLEAVDPTYLPDRHHLLVGQTVPGLTAAPNPPAANGAYECLTCHQLVWDAASSSYRVQVVRDCMACHQTGSGEPNVHHQGGLASARDCMACHGSFVNNIDDGHRIPTYPESLVTPWPSRKPNAGTQGEGNCNFCHNTVALPGSDSTPVVDPISGVLVYRINDTHHGTGLNCSLCHSMHSGDPVRIRNCEKCHGIDSLHNIGYDPDGNGLIPGAEAAGYGHIGADSDCRGCHGFSTAALAVAPASGPVIPGLDTLSVSTVLEGDTPLLVLSGASFINSIRNPVTGTLDVVGSDVQLRDPLGNQIDLVPEHVTSGTIETRLPGFLTPGVYRLMAIKGPKISNAKVLLVAPAVEIYSADCAAGVVTVSGSGFGGYLPAVDGIARILGDMGRRGRGGEETASAIGEVLFWDDTRIRARFPGCPDQVEVTSVFRETAAMGITGAKKEKK